MAGTAYETALETLERFVGEWGPCRAFRLDPSFGPPCACFEWTLNRKFLVQRAEGPYPEAPDLSRHRLDRPRDGCLQPLFVDSVEAEAREETLKAWLDGVYA